MCPPSVDWCFACGLVFSGPVPRSTQSRASWGKLAAFLGGAGVFYFLFVFRITAPGSNVVNLGLMNDRTNGMIAAALVMLVGLAVWQFPQGIGSHGATQTPAAIPPSPPQGFSIPLQDALRYTPSPTIKATTSEVLWRKAVETEAARIGWRHPITPGQMTWGYGHGLDPQRFLSYIEYIENLREYQRIARTA
jgi:hypothetical protein